MLDALRTALQPGGPLHPMAAYPQFMLYRLKPGHEGKLVKLPMAAHSGACPASVTDPANWCDLQTALALLELCGPGHGLAFVFTAADPFWFLDIDNCLDESTGQWRPEALQVLAELPGAAIEVSSSGRGLHAFFSGPAAGPGRRGPNGLELYSQERFAALTGNCSAGGSAAAYVDPCQLLARYFPTRANSARSQAWTTGPVPEWGGPVDDDVLIERMLASKPSMAAGMGRAATPRQLWERDVEALAAVYPSESGKEFNASAADQALANCLAWWTGKDCARIQRLMERSALARDKWEHHATYLENTISLACGGGGGVYPKPQPIEVPAPPAPVTQPIMPEPEFLSGYRLMAQTQQAEHFAGCVWIASIDRIATPRGQLLDSSRFNTAYGGACVFQIDSGHGGKMKTTDKAWTAFTLSQCVSWPKADSVCFRPECPPQSLVLDGGQVLYNIYRPIETYRKPGDPTPFLDLLRRLLPDERDRRILLAYMASLVRNPGLKFQWWPVLQGTQGNGKTFIIRAVEHCVGELYSHLPDVAKLAEGSNFNAWLFGKLFIGMEEVYVPKRRGFLESFKPVVTNTRMAYEAKGQDQFMGDNRANGIMATNHRNGVPIDLDDRRYAVFFTAQQTVKDLARDGMTEAYFRDLYDWFNGRNAYAHHGADHGKAIINEYLRTCAIAEEFDPAGAATRAPRTSSTADAVAESYGTGEAAILQAIEDDVAGFRGGWVSLRAAVKAAQTAGAHMSAQAVGRFLESVGYARHPHLPDGRTNNVVMPDGVKTYLYVKEGSLAMNFTVPAEIAKAYTAANLNLAA